MRIETIKDIPSLKKLETALAKRKEIVEKGRVISGQIEELQKEVESLKKDLNKQGLKLSKIQDKVIPIIEAEVEPNLGMGDFEELNAVRVENGEVVIEILDRVENFKEGYLKAKQDAHNNSGDEGAPGTPADVSPAPETTNE